MSLKRRRERDRPKGGPDDSYDPNKRVLLSYASDGDADVEGASEQPLQQPSQSNQDLSTYQMDEYPEEEGDVEVAAERPAEMGRQKDVPTQRDAEDKNANNRQTQQSKTSNKWGNNVKRNERTNQYPQLGLVSFQWDNEDEDEDYDSTTEEAMAYLRAVRCVTPN